VVVVSPNTTSSTFGTIAVVDDALRAGPEPTSKLIGRVQGTITQSSQESPAFLIVQNFVFSEGKYNGSTLAAFGRATFGPEREYSIVGGSGKFRLARGFAVGRVVTLPVGLTIEFDVYIKRL